MAARLLDLKGLKCPLPVMRARKALRDVPVGETIRVLATDPLSRHDFEAFCEATGNELVEADAQDEVFSFLIRRKV